jgi:hypothetical protein
MCWLKEILLAAVDLWPRCMDLLTAVQCDVTEALRCAGVRVYRTAECQN